MAKRNNVFNMRTFYIEVYEDYLSKPNIQEVEIITELVLFFSLEAYFFSSLNTHMGKISNVAKKPLIFCNTTEFVSCLNISKTIFLPFQFGSHPPPFLRSVQYISSYSKVGLESK